MLLYKEGAVSTRIATTYVTGYPLPGIGGTTPIRRGAEQRGCAGIIGDLTHPLLWASVLPIFLPIAGRRR